MLFFFEYFGLHFSYNFVPTIVWWYSWVAWVDGFTFSAGHLIRRNLRYSFLWICHCNIVKILYQQLFGDSLEWLGWMVGSLAGRGFTVAPSPPDPTYTTHGTHETPHIPPMGSLNLPRHWIGALNDCTSLWAHCIAATFWIAAFSKLESSLDVQTKIQFGRPN